MVRTRITDEDGALLDHVIPLLVTRTRIDGVTVVEALADRVALDDLITHVGRRAGI